jgi:hypothetical protein
MEGWERYKSVRKLAEKVTGLWHNRAMALTLEQAPERLETLRRTLESTGQTTEIQLAQRSAMQALLDQRTKRIGEMQTKSDQIHAFGEDRWHNELTRLSDIDDPELQTFLWRKTPKLWRSFQEAFSNPPDIIVPKMELGKGSPYYAHFVDRLSVRMCLADPDRVPDKLLLMLGLMEESHDDEDEFERLERKYAALSSLKMMWESTGMLDSKYVRVMTVQKANDKAWKHYPAAQDVSDEAVGTVLITREHEENSNGKRNGKDRPFLPRRLVVNPYESVYAARRSTGHITRQYEDDETTTLVRLESDIRTLNRRFNDDWRTDTPSADKDVLVREALEVIARSEELLAQCRQHHKRRVYEMLMGLKASLDRKHVGGAMSKMVAAVNAVDARTEDMGVKSKHNTGARDVLNNVIKKNEHGLRTHRLSVSSNVRVIGTDIDAYTEELTGKARDRHIRMVMRPLRVPEILSNTPPVRPHHTYIYALRQQEEELEAALHAGDKERAKLAGVRMHVFGKLQAANICLEKLKEILSDPKQASMTKIRTYVATLDQILQERGVFPDMEPLHFAAIYEPIERDIATLHEMVEEAGENIEEDTEAFEKYCKELLQFVDTMDIETVTRELMEKIAMHAE